MLAASLAFAQSEENLAAARALAGQGAQAFGAGRYAEAIDLFERAESLVHAPTHLLYQARAAEKLGQLVRARELMVRVQREPLSPNAPEAFRQAQSEAQREALLIEPRLAKLTIVLSAPKGVSVTLQMDDKPVPSAVVGVPYPVDPGEHRLEAKAEGYLAEPVDLRLAEGEVRSIELKLQPDPKAAALAPASAEPAPSGPPPLAQPLAAEPKSRSGGWMRIGAFVGLGVGVGGAGLAGAF